MPGQVVIEGLGDRGRGLHGHRIGGHDLPHGHHAQLRLQHRLLVFRGGRADQEPADQGEPYPVVLGQTSTRYAASTTRAHPNTCPAR